LSWPIVTLGELVSVKGGKRLPKGSEYAESKTAHAYIRVTDFENNSVRQSKLVYITSDIHKKIARYTISSEDVYISIAGTIGIVGVIPEVLNGANLTENAAKLLIKDPKVLDKNYLMRFLSTAGQNQLHEKKKTTSQPKLALFRIEEVEIPLPPLDEQKRIAAILDKADAIRRKRQQAIQLADDFLRSVFLDMFGDPVSNPKGWEVEKLGELTTIRRGASPRPIANFIGGDVPWIKIGDGSKGDQVYLNATKVHVTKEGAAKSVFLEKGSLIFANCGVSLGFARILNISGCIHDGWLSIENIDKDLNKIFILKWINQLTLYFRRIAPDGTQPNLNSAIMKAQEIILPPIELQNKFEDILFKHESLLAKVNVSMTLTDNIFNSISQKAFAGEL
jgi:type I restriction enzyme S subunit